MKVFNNILVSLIGLMLCVPAFSLRIENKTKGTITVNGSLKTIVPLYYANGQPMNAYNTESQIQETKTIPAKQVAEITLDLSNDNYEISITKGNQRYVTIEKMAVSGNIGPKNWVALSNGLNAVCNFQSSNPACVICESRDVSCALSK